MSDICLWQFYLIEKTACDNPNAWGLVSVRHTRHCKMSAETAFRNIADS